MVPMNERPDLTDDWPETDTPANLEAVLTSFLRDLRGKAPDAAELDRIWNDFAQPPRVTVRRPN